MKKIGKVLFHRVVLVSLFILLQLVVMLATVSWLSEYRQWVHVLLTVLSVVVIIYLMYDRTNPSYKIAWIFLILAFPVAGICIYLTFGGRRLSRPVRQRMQLADDIIRENLWQEKITMESLRSISDPAAVQASFLYNVTGFPVYDNTETEYFSLGDLVYPRMLEELRKAEQYIFLEYFIIGEGVMWDGILEILRQKAAEGVDVRVMYDDFGCITTLPNYYERQLERWGIRAKVFNPFVPVLSGRLNNRNHRKLMIIDGKVGFTGGVNLADEYINLTHPHGHWKDCAVLVRGEAVWSMTAMFLAFWGYVDRSAEDLSVFRPRDAAVPSDGFLQPFADSPLDHENVGASMYQSLIRSARRYVWLMTPYLILDDEMLSALCTAAKTGLDVRIVTPGVPDKWYVHAVTRANYEALTAAGVRIYEYTPGFVHSKLALADGKFALVGTVNLDFRSLYLHFEDGVYLCGASAIEDIHADFAATFPKCEEITYAACKRTHPGQRLLQTLLKLFSPLL